MVAVFLFLLFSVGQGCDYVPFRFSYFFGVVVGAQV